MAVVVLLVSVWAMSLMHESLDNLCTSDLIFNTTAFEVSDTLAAITGDFLSRPVSINQNTLTDEGNNKATPATASL
jgi:hypothetical protein